LGGGGLGGGDLKHCAHAPHVVHPHRCAHVCARPVFCETELGHQFWHSSGGDGGGGVGGGGEGVGGGGEGSGGGDGVGGGDGLGAQQPNVEV